MNQQSNPMKSKDRKREGINTMAYVWQDALALHNNAIKKKVNHLELSGTFIFLPSCWTPMTDASSSTAPLLICRNCTETIRDSLQLIQITKNMNCSIQFKNPPIIKVLGKKNLFLFFFFTMPIELVCNNPDEKYLMSNSKISHVLATPSYLLSRSFLLCHAMNKLFLQFLRQLTSSRSPSYVNWEHMGVTMSTYIQGTVNLKQKP